MANEKNREPEFTVTDRRKFSYDEVMNSAPDTTPVVEPEAVAPRPIAETAHADVATPPPVEPAHEPFAEGWESPSEDDQNAQSDAYHQSGVHLDSALDEQQPGLSQQIGAATFDRLVALISTQALLLMGALAPEGQQPRVDVVGARQQIDLLEVLREKTVNNLTVKEQSILDNTLFELRMMFIEIMNAFTKAPQPGQGN